MMAKQYYIITDGKRYFITDEYGTKAGSKNARQYGFKTEAKARAFQNFYFNAREAFKEATIQKQQFKKNELQHFKSI